MSTKNLLRETTEALPGGGRGPLDVAWVGSRDGKFTCTWDQFAAMADREYDAGYGGAEVSRELVVVGGGWWLERHEYDGSEWWEFKSSPTPAPGPRPCRECSWTRTTTTRCTSRERLPQVRGRDRGHPHLRLRARAGLRHHSTGGPGAWRPDPRRVALPSGRPARATSDGRGCVTYADRMMFWGTSFEAVDRFVQNWLTLPAWARKLLLELDR